MDLDGQFKYKFLMSNRLTLPEHFKKRYKERVSKSSLHRLDFVKEAYRYGSDAESLNDNNLRRFLTKKSSHGSTCKIYKGFVFWFIRDTAMTVYPISTVARLTRSSIND